MLMKFSPTDPNRNTILQYMHCDKCIQSLPDGISPQERSQIEVGLTLTGIQIRCIRHDMVVAEFTPQGLFVMLKMEQ